MRLDRQRLLVAGVAAVCLLAASTAVAAAQTADADADLMPDAWEAFYGLNPTSAADAAADPDGDGLTNLQEFQAGRHPNGRYARFFAEGSTGYFDTSIAILNLSATETAHLSLALMNEAFPLMQTMYHSEATTATECQDLMGMSFRTAHFDGSARVPS